MVCANITFRMPLAMAISLSSPNAASCWPCAAALGWRWAWLHGCMAALWDAVPAGTQQLLLRGSLQAGEVTEDRIKPTRCKCLASVQSVCALFSFFLCFLFLFVCFNVCQSFWGFLRLCGFFNPLHHCSMTLFHLILQKNVWIYFIL